ncbi:hypothetical protein [Hoeflea sp. IMCC20628]|nr:hypothetical protein [Hoeflea sp. IMCC20628]
MTLAFKQEVGFRSRAGSPLLSAALPGDAVDGNHPDYAALT